MGFEDSVRPSACGLEAAGFHNLKRVYWNLRPTALYEMALRREEGHLAAAGPLVVSTGKHTGRSAPDKFIVKDAHTADNVWWANNKAMVPEKFDLLHRDMMDYAERRELFAQNLFAGADPAYRLRLQVVTEHAWQSLFIHNLLIRPDADALTEFTPTFTVIDLPGFTADPTRHGCASSTVIAVNFTRRMVLIGGTSYAGEIKKSVFTIMNYLLPTKGVMSMHCSANVGASNDAAIFFGLSGTGKTTLSADASRTLVGDDEHGWGPNGVFNIEGGCYAKVIRLNRKAEPEIFSTTERFGTILENVVFDKDTRALDLDDARYTENTRAAYPIDFIRHASSTGRTGHPKNMIMLTADAFGVLPPIAHLTPSQAMYHFLSGFTAKVAGTEKNLGKDPLPTFSTCFGAPFMPRHPCEYGNLLRALMARHQADCWLVNTGWTGGPFGTGLRVPINVTRALLNAALSGALAETEMRVDPHFRFNVPLAVPHVAGQILNPRDTWADKAAYDAQARKLVRMFRENFRRFEAYVDSDVIAAMPEFDGAAPASASISIRETKGR
ncbi:MAG: phosphoenolpyruvate carboxykinase [Alphaproteobacteria bacterium]|nr:phosphoenolpyruvate carboxykinase [Alphaproteobacteria bacterium]MDE2493074.1 phosphoenolpyruvate carboxykinase [Alphaproteobacteria bacterium]